MLISCCRHYRFRHAVMIAIAIMALMILSSESWGENNSNIPPDSQKIPINNNSILLNPNGFRRKPTSAKRFRSFPDNIIRSISTPKINKLENKYTLDIDNSIPIGLNIDSIISKSKSSLQDFVKKDSITCDETTSTKVEEGNDIEPAALILNSSKDSDFVRTLAFAKSRGYLNFLWAEEIRFSNGLRQSIIGIEENTDDEALFLVRFELSGKTKSVLVGVSDSSIDIFDSNGGLIINLNSGNISLNRELGTNKGTCDYWSCVAGCIGEVGGLIAEICSEFIIECAIDPTKITCGAALACLGVSAGYCLVDCGIDVCSYCDCSSNTTTIKGRILQEDGTAWGGVGVCIFDCNGYLLGEDYCTTTDDDGSFIISFETPSVDILLGLFRGCDPPLVTNCFTPIDGEINIGELALPSCDVTMEISTGESGVYVFIVDCNTEEIVVACQTDNSGSCSGTMEPGDYFFAFARDCDCYMYATESCFEIPAGNYEINIELPLCSQEVCLTGKVKHTNGASWPELDIYIVDCDYNIITTDKTDGSGNYEVCFEENEFIIAFDRGCCSGDIIGTECIALTPCEYSVDDIMIEDCINAIPGQITSISADPNSVDLNEPYEIKWSQSNLAEYYEISENGGSWNNIGNITKKTYSKSIAGTYKYKVRGANECGPGTPSNEAEVTVEQPNPPHIVINHTSISFVAVEGGELPEDQGFTISNSGGGVLNWHVVENEDWLDINPTGPDNSNSVNVKASILTTELSPQLYSADVEISSDNADNSPQIINVAYEVESDGQPEIFVDNSEILFEAVQYGDLPLSQTFKIQNTGQGVLNWSIIQEGGGDWLEIAPIGPEDNNDNTITVSPTTTSLLAQTYNTTLHVTSSNAINSPQNVSVQYNIFAECSEPMCFDYSGNSEDYYPIIIDFASLDGLEIGECYEIGVFDKGLCVGAGVFQGTWPISIQAWEDDPQTSEIDGFVAGNDIIIRISNPDNCELYYVENAQYTLGDGTFGYGSYSRISHMESYSERCLAINLHSDWNWISINSRPNENDPSTIFESIWEDINIIKAQEAFCIPDVVCGIEAIIPEKCYKINLKDDRQIEICGLPLNSNEAINLNSGWNWLGFFPNCCMIASTAVETIEENLDILKGEEGFYVPPDNFLGDMCPGQGFTAHLSSPSLLTYPDCVTAIPKSNYNTDQRREAISHYRIMDNGSDYHAIVIEDNNYLQFGDEVGVFTKSGVLIGSGIYLGDRIPLKAWIEDSSDDEFKGGKIGESFDIRVFRKAKNEEFIPFVRILEGETVLGSSPYTIIELADRGDNNLPEMLYLSANYPNPFNPETKIDFSIPIAGRTNLSIFNIIGQKVVTLVDRHYEPGNYSIEWDGNNAMGEKVTSGIYFYRLITDYGEIARKLVLLK